MKDFQEEGLDRDYYETGSTRPPKNYFGVVSVLLIALVIYIGGYGLMDRLLPEEKTAESTPDNGVATADLSEVQPTYAMGWGDSVERATAPAGEYEMHIKNTPLSADNVPQEGGLSLHEIYKKARVSVVSVSAATSDGTVTGSGVVLSRKGYIVTSCQVVAGGSGYRVVLSDGREVDAVLVGMDEMSDLAVLKIEAEGLTPAEFGDSGKLRVGDSVVAIGDPLGITLRGTMTDGIVCGINRDINAGGRTMTLIQTNAAMNSGNAGGPLLNCYGQVVGINTMMAGNHVGAAPVEGLRFAVPSATVKEIVEQLITQGYVSGRPALGFAGESVDRFYQLYYHMPAGVYVKHVNTGSAADAGGLRHGDIITHIDGVEIGSMEDLQKILYAHGVGDEVTLTVSRGDSQLEIRLLVEEAGI